MAKGQDKKKQGDKTKAGDQKVGQAVHWISPPRWHSFRRSTLLIKIAPSCYGMARMPAALTLLGRIARCALD